MSISISIVLLMVLFWFFWEKAEQYLYLKRVERSLEKVGFTPFMAKTWTRQQYYNVMYGWSKDWPGERTYRVFSNERQSLERTN